MEDQKIKTEREIITEWKNKRCVCGPLCKETAYLMYEDFNSWYQVNISKEQILTQRKFYNELKVIFPELKIKHSDGFNYLKGICLK